MAFGSDGVSTMVGSWGSVATRIHYELNPFFLSHHYVARHTNLATLDPTEVFTYKVLSHEMNSLFNSISSFLNKFSKCKYALMTLQGHFFDSKKRMKCCYKIHWFNRWQVVTTLSDLLEFVLAFF